MGLCLGPEAFKTSPVRFHRFSFAAFWSELCVLSVAFLRPQSGSSIRIAVLETRSHRPRIARPGFSLLEMIMVMSTMGFIAAIAIPRLSAVTDNSRAAGVKASVRNLQFAVEMYAAEHLDRSPAENADGSIESDPAVVTARLIMQTDDNGSIVAGGPYGPYLKEWPTNMAIGKSTLRIGGAAPGAGTDGWQMSPVSRVISSDEPGWMSATAPGRTTTTQTSMTAEAD